MIAREEYIQICKDSFFAFFVLFWKEVEPDELHVNWHIQYLCDELQDVAERVFKREPLKHNLIINISPGESKSSISTVFFPVWCWIRDPSVKVITASYSKDLAMYHSQKSRDLIKSDKFQRLFGHIFQLRRDMDAKTYFGNDHSGMRVTASVGSTITGKHAHILIVDDPLNVKQAGSDTERENANEWMTKTLPTRKTDQEVTPTILIMQRLHEEDCTAVCAKAWKKAGQLKHIRLPADLRYEVSPQELRERYTPDGDLSVMNPVRKPASVIRRMEAEMTTTEASGQLGQNPTPAEGNKLKKDWFKNRFSIAELEAKQAKKRMVPAWNATIDGAYTKKTTNSATGVLIWTMWNRQLYFRAYAQMFLEFPDLCKELPRFLVSNGVDLRGMAYVEPKGPGLSLIQTLRKQAQENGDPINIVEDPLPDGMTQQAGKEMRVDGITPYVRGMNCHFLEGVDWDSFISQCVTFPNASHSDLVDTFVMACEKAMVPDDYGDWMDYFDKKK